MRPSSVVSLDHLTTNGRMLLLAGDTAMEYGPEALPASLVDPLNVYSLAIAAEVNAIVFGRGIAEQYHAAYVNEIPIVIKLNLHTKFNYPHAYGLQNCTVAEALSFGASAVGYTLHMGGIHEAEQIREIGVIVREAHTLGLPVILWVVPQGPEIPRGEGGKHAAYAVRTAMELGADVVVVDAHGLDAGAMTWIGACAGKTQVLLNDTASAQDQAAYLAHLQVGIAAALEGAVVGASVLGAHDPAQALAAVKQVVYAA
jgi:DhnA family fructose-bisphosphate aldolase class Ia